MKCPYCKSLKTGVIDKRPTENLEVIRRRRECLKCKKRFTTYERLELTNLTVIKKDGRREPFNREKIKIGIVKACEKRPISIEKIEETVNIIENSLKRKNSKEIPTTFIGEQVMNKLKTLDKIAYIRFASVYREFTDLSSFEQELKDLKKR